MSKQVSLKREPTIIMEQIPLDLRNTSFANELPMLPLFPEGVKSKFLQNHETIESRDEAIALVSRSINEFFVDQMKKSSPSDAASTPESLNVYDQFLWGFNCPFLWGITPDHIHDLYEECVSSYRHCEIAVGTGLFLTTKPAVTNRLSHLTLIDKNPDTLQFCEQRLLTSRKWNDDSMNLKRYEKESLEITKIEGNILDPISLPTNSKNKKFESIAANFILHDLHGGEKTTRKVLKNVAAILDDDYGVFFGSTILGHELHHEDAKNLNVSSAAIDSSTLYNKLGIFDNLQDSLDGLNRNLEEVFEDVELYRVGFCAVWKARQPKRFM